MLKYFISFRQKNKIDEMLKNLINLFFPPVCNSCKKPLNTNELAICVRCRHEIPCTNHLLQKNNEARTKFEGKLPVEHVSAMTYYHKNGIMQHLIHQLKYKNQQIIGSVLGDWYTSSLVEDPTLKTVDVIIPVPLHQKRLKERGYNQVTTFSKAIAAGLEIPLEEKLLIRSQYATTQSKKNSAERNATQENPFTITDGAKYEGKHFLLIDDVLTTGATLEACGKALLQIPNSKVSIITIAFSHS